MDEGSGGAEVPSRAVGARTPDARWGFQSLGEGTTDHGWGRRNKGKDCMLWGGGEVGGREGEK